MPNEKCTFCRRGADKGGGLYRSVNSKYWYHYGHEPINALEFVVWILFAISMISFWVLYFLF